MYNFFRGRRLRNSESLRTFVRETHLHPEDFLQPYFVAETDETNFCQEIPSMPGQYQLSLTMLEKRVEKAVDKGLHALMLFGIPESKDECGSQAWAENGIVQQAVHRLKNRWPKLLIVTDVCLCEYTSHGHCGLIGKQGVENDSTLELLTKTSLSHAKAGADIIAPSDMMDGRIAAIRQTLDANGFCELPIMSYAVKYASAYYGPFRDAAKSAPKFGDRRAYQMDSANALEAVREASADAEEGADILMIKPAGPYLDIVRMIKDRFDMPIAAYQVSGEYAIIKAGAKLGYVDEKALVLESLLGIKRAGADIILTYFAETVLDWL